MKDEIIVRYCLGKSPEEIAKELDLSLEFVKLSLSLEILKQTFRKYMSE
jgi:DNA-directed RNA polymerase specialized sigma24 family protein